MPRSSLPIGNNLTRFAGRRVLVVGLGRFGGGVGVTRWLVHHGADVTVSDRAEPGQLAESVQAITDLGVRVHLGGHDPRDLQDKDLVIVNPAVDKRRSSFFRQIVERGIPWTTEINLFCGHCPATIIGVTGSYGKSTTCAMLAAVLDAWTCSSQAPFTGVHLGGNIGRSLLPEMGIIRPSDVVVLEMSNAQLEDLPRIPWAPPVAVIINLFPHHLDRYGGFEGYIGSKLSIARDPQNMSRVFVGQIHAAARPLVDRLLPSEPGRVKRITQAHPPIDLRVPGDHNQANATCVLAVCRHLGVDEALVRETLSTFRGLPHRLEFVRTIAGVDYYNDSKSTSPAATVTAVQSLRQPIVAIVGGKNQEVLLDEWAATMILATRLVICTGESGPAFAKALRSVAHAENGAAIRETKDLEQAVRLAHARAQAGEAVLFSPGAPSFDRYANFADRGQHFSDVVEAL